MPCTRTRIREALCINKTEFGIRVPQFVNVGQVHTTLVKMRLSN